MRLEELKKIESSQTVYYNGTVAYLYISTDKRYYLFSNETSLNGSDPYPSLRNSLGYAYSYWLADGRDCDPHNYHLNIVIAKKGRRPI